MTRNVLVAYASKYGATREIAQRVGETLRTRGMTTSVLDAEKAPDVRGYDAVVAGASVYMGRMRKEMRRFLTRNESSLDGKPVWLFASGPTSRSDNPGELDGWHHPSAMGKLVERLAPRDRVVFAGAIFADRLGGFDRWIMNMVKAPAEDAREWERIDGWANAIADDLTRDERG